MTQSQTPIFDQLCEEFLKQRKVSYQSLVTPTRPVAPFHPVQPITPVKPLQKMDGVRPKLVVMDEWPQDDTQPIDVSTLRAS